ncbi:EI24 domain-containing protein [Sulfurimonas sp.]|uniref:EI24 domain-containing protein n=1 Tax=Sulfurimonas sp. TaxID=2022749 RepID=UPI003563409A
MNDINSEKNLILLSIQDFFTTQMLKYSLAPFIITIVLMYIIFFVVAGIGVESMGQMQVHTSETTMQNGIPHTESVSAMLEGSAIIQFLMSYAITSWIATFLIYAIGSFLILYASIFIAVLVIGFLTPFVLKELQKRHYNDIEMIGYSNIFSGLFLVLKWTVTMLLLFILLIPFYFIPLVNVIAFNLPLYYFFYKMITFDISSNICTKEEYKKIHYFSGNKIILKTLALYIISLVPFAIFFGAIYYVIYLGHTYFLEVRKIRNEVVVA